MTQTILRGKYDIGSFSFDGELVITLRAGSAVKKISFGDRIVFTGFYEEELANPGNFPYYNQPDIDIRNTTLIQDTNSARLKRIAEDWGDFYAPVKHYILLAENHIMEIVSFDEVRECGERGV